MTYVRACVCVFECFLITGVCVCVCVFVRTCVRACSIRRCGVFLLYGLTLISCIYWGHCIMCVNELCVKWTRHVCVCVSVQIVCSASWNLSFCQCACVWLCVQWVCFWMFFHHGTVCVCASLCEWMSEYVFMNQCVHSVCVCLCVCVFLVFTERPPFLLRCSHLK